MHMYIEQLLNNPLYVNLLKNNVYKFTDVNLNLTPISEKIKLIGFFGETYFSPNFPIELNNFTYNIHKIKKIYQFSKISLNIYNTIEKSICEGNYKYMYFLNNLNNKTLSAMETKKAIFIPVRFDATSNDVGAIISQEKLVEYVATSEEFQNIEKKTNLLDLIQMPLTESRIIDISL